MLNLSAAELTEGSMSLFAEYILEREGKHTIENEKGFATYAFVGDSNGDGIGRCYIESIYVKPEFRQSDVAKQLADEIVKHACQVGCKILLGSVSPAAKNSTDSLRVLLAYGFKLDSAEKNFILFAKDIL